MWLLYLSSRHEIFASLLMWIAWLALCDYWVILFVPRVWRQLLGSFLAHSHFCLINVHSCNKRNNFLVHFVSLSGFQIKFFRKLFNFKRISKNRNQAVHFSAKQNQKNLIVHPYRRNCQCWWNFETSHRLSRAAPQRNRSSFYILYWWADQVEAASSNFL